MRPFRTLHAMREHISKVKQIQLMDVMRNCREQVQSWIAELNRDWATKEMPIGELRPDGDIDVAEEALHSFIVPHCPDCGPGSILKTDVVFFGDCVPTGVVEHCYQMVYHFDWCFLIVLDCR